MLHIHHSRKIRCVAEPSRTHTPGCHLPNLLKWSLPKRIMAVYLAPQCENKAVTAVQFQKITLFLMKWFMVIRGQGTKVWNVSMDLSGLSPSCMPASRAFTGSRKAEQTTIETSPVQRLTLTKSPAFGRIHSDSITNVPNQSFCLVLIRWNEKGDGRAGWRRCKWGGPCEVINTSDEAGTHSMETHLGFCGNGSFFHL